MVIFYGVPAGLHNPIAWACEKLSIPSGVGLIFDFEDMSATGDHGEMCDYDLEESEFYINIEETLDTRDSVIAIFHELYHVKQIMDGRLGFESGPTMWLGKDYEIAAGTLYGDLPWEKEAFFMEEVLYKEYVQTPGCVIESG